MKQGTLLRSVKWLPTLNIIKTYSKKEDFKNTSKICSLNEITVENLDDYERSDSKENFLKRSKSKRRKDHVQEKFIRTGSKEAMLNEDISEGGRVNFEYGRTTSRDNLINRSKGKKKTRRKNKLEK